MSIGKTVYENTRVAEGHMIVKDRKIWMARSHSRVSTVPHCKQSARVNSLPSQTGKCAQMFCQWHLLLGPQRPPTASSFMLRTSEPTMMIVGYHGDAQTPNVRLHTVPLLVELRVYSFRLEKRQTVKKWKDN